MKKLCVIAVAILAAALSVVGCGSKDVVKAPSNGVYYNLQEAYDYGWITADELKSIASYYAQKETGKEVPADYKQLELKPLSNENEQNVKLQYLNKEVLQINSEATVDNVQIKSYYGTYKNCVVAFLNNDFLLCYEPRLEDEKIIGGVKFELYSESRLPVWFIGE